MQIDWSGFKKIELIEVQFKNKFTKFTIFLMLHSFTTGEFFICSISIWYMLGTSLPKAKKKIQPANDFLYILKSVEIKAGILCDGLFLSLGTLLWMSRRKPTPEKKQKRIKQCQFNGYIKLKCNVISLLFGFLFEQKQLQVEMIHRATTTYNYH